MIEELKSRIRSSFAGDPAVEEVERLGVSIAATGMIQIDIHLRIAGMGQRFGVCLRRTE